MTTTEPIGTFAEAAQPSTHPLPGLGRARRHRHVEPRDSRDPYKLAHDRCRALRGRASEYRCCDCLEQASAWSLIEHPVGNLHAACLNGSPVWWSDDPYDLEPRCSGCHTSEDRRRRQAFEAEWERWLSPPPYACDPDFGWYR